MEKCVLAYSGGLDTSVMIPWIKEAYGCEIVAMCADVGQGEELDGLEEKALKTGASKAYIEDLREEFVADYIFPTLKAGAVYESTYLLGTSFARPVIAKRQVEIAHKEGATMVAHVGGAVAPVTRTHIKAVTFHDLELVEEAGGWSTAITFDV